MFCFEFVIWVIGIYPSTLLRVVSPSTSLRTVSLSNGLSNHLLFEICYLEFQDSNQRIRFNN